MPRCRCSRDQENSCALHGTGGANGGIAGGRLGDAADSPIVRDATQAFFGRAITWRSDP